MEDKMKKNKPFYIRVDFYLTTVAFLLALVALVLYAAGCPSEFNGGKASSAVVAWDAIAVVMGALAIGIGIAEYFTENALVKKISSYRRFAAFAMFAFLILGFLMQILDEYSLLGTILYPIVSGTVGDPVDSTLSACYFTALIFTFVSMWGALAAGIVGQVSSYREEKDERLAVSNASAGEEVK